MPEKLCPPPDDGVTDALALSQELEPSLAFAA
jgi:hypothetical protein